MKGIPKYKPLPPPKVSIDDILAFAEEYRKETGVYLGFAKAREEMKRRGYPV